MFWKVKQDANSWELVNLRGAIVKANYELGLAQGSMQQMGDELRELRETNRRLLDHIAAVNGATPIFNPTIPATADGTKPVTFNQTPRDFVEEAEELERKALRDRQNDLLQEFANRRAREMEEVPKESAA